MKDFTDWPIQIKPIKTSPQIALPNLGTCYDVHSIIFGVLWYYDPRIHPMIFHTALMTDLDIDDDFAQFERELAAEAPPPSPPPSSTNPDASHKPPSQHQQHDAPSKVVISAAPVLSKTAAGANWKQDLQQRDLKLQAQETARTQHVDEITKQRDEVTHAQSSNPIQSTRPVQPTKNVAGYHTRLNVGSKASPTQYDEGQVEGKKKAHVRTAAGTVWKDNTLAEWPENDFRIFVGDLGKDSTDVHLTEAFKVYPSFNKAKVVTEKRTGLCKGYGFVSFQKGEDMIKALKQMNGKYIAGRPVKLKKSNWQKRELTKGKKSELRLYKQITKYK